MKKPAPYYGPGIPKLNPKYVRRRVFVGGLFALGAGAAGLNKIARAGLVSIAGGRTSVNPPGTGGGGSGDPLSLPLYNPANISYLGRFNLPQNAGANHEGFKYSPNQGGGAIAYNPDGNGGAGSLFIGGGTVNNNQHTTVIAEVSIPTPRTTGPFNTASMLQNFTGVCEGDAYMGSTVRNGAPLTGLQVAGGRLAMSVAGWYLSGENQPYSIAARSSLNLATSTVLGPHKVTNLAQQRVPGVGLGCLVPDNWKSVFGNYEAIFGGGANVSTGNDTCGGPQIGFYNPSGFDGLNVNTPKPSTHAVYYQPLGAFGVFAPGTGNEIWTGMSTHRGTVMLPDSRTILCYGCHGEAFYDIGGQTSGTGVMGTYSRNLWDRFWLYDAADDILDGFNGSIPKNDGAQPYGVHDMNFCLRNTANSGDPYISELEQVRGGTWAANQRRFYVVEAGMSPDYFPCVHVLQFA